MISIGSVLVNFWRFGWLLFLIATITNAGSIVCFAVALRRNRGRGVYALMGFALLLSGIVLAAHLTLGF